jgi:hypothetical protein
VNSSKAAGEAVDIGPPVRHWGNWQSVLQL